MKTLAIAAFAAACLVGGAASAQTARVAFGDLDLSSPAGAAQLDARIDAAARDYCRARITTGTRITADRAACLSAVRQEVMERLAANPRANGQVTRDAALRLAATSRSNG